MTGMPPDEADETRQPAHRERSADEVNAQFAAIVSGMNSEMSWGATTQELDSTATAGTVDVREPTDVDARDGWETAKERERRRALRKAQRAEEVELFEAGRAEAEAEMQSDEAHFVPPEPPPLPRPKRRTVAALLVMAVGLLMIVRPGLFQVAPDVVLVLGIGCLIGGFGMLIHGLRPRAADPEDGDGWDDGARL
jgi:hypothetical protein